MSFELNILVVQQEEPRNIKSTIEIINEKQESIRYTNIWRFMSNTNGIMYTLGKEEDGLFTALPLIDTNFENPKHYPYWIRDEDVLSNLTPLSLRTKYEKELVKILEQMIQMSPIKTIMFMTRYQGGDTEIVCGVISLKDFLDSLKEGKILFNVCYIIQS